MKRKNKVGISNVTKGQGVAQLMVETQDASMSGLGSPHYHFISQI